MSFLGKDGSWVNKVIFPAPKPSSYNADTFDPFGEACKLCYIPRKQAAVRRPADSDHDPNSVPCIWLPCSAPGASKILIYCHGNSEDIGHSAGMLAKIRDYLKCHVLGVEYPGYGMSEGSPSENGINNDLLVVYSFLTGVMKWPKTDIILYGFSIGTGPSTYLAAHNEVGGLVLLAPYTSIRDMVPEVLPTGLGKFAQFLISNRFDNGKEIRKVKCPALFIHGRSDELIPHRHSETLYKNCGSERKEIYLADTMTHCFNDDDLEAFVLFPVMGFFDLKGNKRTCTFPPYVFKKPPPKVEEKADGVSQSASTDGAAAEAKKEKEEDIGWNCGVCTYNNRSASNMCEMCNSPKTLAFASVDRDPPPSAADGDNKEAEAQPSLAVMQWSCPTCTLINPPSAKRCTVCGSKNASSSPPTSSHIGIADDRGPISSGASQSDLSGSLAALSVLSRAIEHGSEVQPATGGSPSKGPSLSVHSDEDALAPLSAALPWECPVCTYVNPHSNLRCEICDRPSKS